MNEREMEVLQQYELQVRRINRFRGAFLCETGQGLRLLKETAASEERLQWEAWILDQCQAMGHVPVETYIRNRDGRLLCRSADYRYYWLRMWQEGQECDRENQEDVIQAAEALALLHTNFRQLQESLSAWEKEWRREWDKIRQEEREAAQMREAKRREENGVGLRAAEEKREEGKAAAPVVRERTASTAEVMCRHNREMNRARSFIRKIKRKSELEMVLLKEFSRYLPMAEEAAARMEELNLPEDGLCHGDFAYHHLFRGTQGVMITDFGRMHHGVSQADLYLLLCKTMEHRDWDVALAREILTHYEQILPLGTPERQYLYLRFLYPEKFWKQVNFYYNHRKSWISARNLEKLRLIVAQRPDKENFLRWMAAEYIV